MPGCCKVGFAKQAVISPDERDRPDGSRPRDRHPALSDPRRTPRDDYPAFALFMGVSMSITAFPVLTQILVERRMIRRPVGVIALASAAVDDVTAWGLLNLATAAVASATDAKDPVLKTARILAHCTRSCSSS